jgi:hypothetical protein
LATELQLSISTFLAFGFYIAAYWLQSSEYVKHVAVFFVTTVCIQQLSAAMSVKDSTTLRSYITFGIVDGSESDINVGVAGIVMCWLAFVRAISHPLVLILSSLSSMEMSYNNDV